MVKFGTEVHLYSILYTLVKNSIQLNVVSYENFYWLVSTSQRVYHSKALTEAYKNYDKIFSAVVP